jgi:hypothetical protein
MAVRLFGVLSGGREARGASKGCAMMFENTDVEFGGAASAVGAPRERENLVGSYW